VSAATPEAPTKIFELELLKLLLQVAWADHEVAPAEAEALRAFARRSGLADIEQQQLADMLAGRVPLAPPDFGLLKARRTDVLRAVKELLLADVALADDEEDLLGQIAALLG
jgi:uncharacterized tellurite resistance protein B-like protein